MGAGRMKNSNVMNMLVAAGLVAGLASSALAQLVTPPTEAPKKSESYVMPPPPPPTPVKSPETPNVGAPVISPPVEAKPAPLENLPFKSLVVKGSDGKIFKLTEPVELAALKVNPVVDDALRAKLQPAIAERNERFEKLVISNCDLVEKLGGDLLDNLDLTKREDLPKVLQYLKPVTPPAAPQALGNELKRKNLINDTQKRWNDKIVKEYNDAIQAEVKASQAAPAPGANKADAARGPLKAYLSQAIAEPIWVHHQLLNEVASRTDMVLAGVDSAASAPIRSAVANLKPGASSEDRAHAVSEAMKGLTIEQKRTILTRAVETREVKK